MAAPAPNPTLINQQQRAIVIGNSLKLTQPIFSQLVDPTKNLIVNVAPKYAGLILGFIVEVSGTATNGATTQADRTGFGSANIVKNFTLTDTSNVTRINTPGYHLALLNSARQGFGFGGAYAPNLPMSFGNNWSPFAAPVSLAANAAGTVRHTYYVPCAYSSQDLRGAIWAGLVGATMNLQITLNGTPFVGAVGVGAADPLNAIYQANAAGIWTGNITVNVTQVYLDQLPRLTNGAPLLPSMDINTIYDIKSIAQNGMAVGQDFAVSYAPYRQYLSTMPIFDNGGVYNTGSDVNTWSLRSANNMDIWKVSANIAAFQARQTFMADPPPGVYYFNHDKPVDTINFGNMQLVLNAATVNANAQLLVGYEGFQQVSQTDAIPSLNA